MRLMLALVLAAVSLGQDSRIYTTQDGATLPTVVRKVHAEYTNEAKQNRIEGEVGLSVVVLSDGKVGDVTVSKSLDSVYGLDKEAVKAMKQWQFKPGAKDGKAVAVRVAVEMTFSLQ